MDRHNTRFTKLRGGHPRNVSPYLMMRQKMKRWQKPFIALGALFLFFASATLTGEEFQTNVLNDSKDSAVKTKIECQSARKNAARHLELAIESLAHFDFEGTAQIKVKIKNALDELASENSCK